jgi:MerC mercury resistance protein
MTTKASSSLDRVAIGLSSFCALHCLVTPAAVILFPALSACFGSDRVFHVLLLTLVVPSSVLALTLGCRLHRDAWVLGFGVIGLNLLLITVAIGHVELWERPMTFSATALIVAAHVRNYRLCRSGRCTH